MNAIMLGDSTVGKTTMMMASYGLINKLWSNSPFHVELAEIDQNNRIIEEYHLFQNQDIYPESTSHFEEYPITVRCGKQNWVDFSISDIRGETIHDSDNAELIGRLQKADAVLLFFDAKQILEASDPEADFDLYALLNTSFYATNHLKLILTIICQTDKIAPLTDEIKIKLEQYIDPLKTMADKNQNVEFFNIPIACNSMYMLNLDIVWLKLIAFFGNLQKLLEWESICSEELEIKRLLNCGSLSGLKNILGINPDYKDAIERRKKLELRKKKYHLIESICSKFEKFKSKWQTASWYKIRRIKPKSSKEILLMLLPVAIVWLPWF